MKWAVEIQKTSLERRNLVDLLKELEFEIVDGIEYIAFTSTSFDALETNEEVWIEAKKLRDVITGPTFIDPSFTLGAIIDYSEDNPTRHHFLEVHDNILIHSSCSATISYTLSPDMTEDERKEFLEDLAEREYQAKLDLQRSKLTPAFRNPKALKVLELLQNDHSGGIAIYRIYELMEGHPKNRKEFHHRFDITKEEFQRFKDAVHNFNVSGDQARHTYEEEPKSEMPMNLQEAKSFVEQLAKKWMANIREDSIDAKLKDD